MKTKKQLLIILLAIFLLRLPSFGAAYPELLKPLTDYAGIINQTDKFGINAKIKDLKEKENISLNVITIKSLASYDKNINIEDMALNLLNSSMKGDSESRAILLLFSLEDREVIIQMSPLYENTMDSAMDEIIQKHMVPCFKEENYSKGIKTGVSKITDLMKGKVPLSKEKTENYPETNPSLSYPSYTGNSREYAFCGVGIMVVIFVILCAAFSSPVNNSYGQPYGYYNRNNNYYGSYRNYHSISNSGTSMTSWGSSRKSSSSSRSSPSRSSPSRSSPSRSSPPRRSSVSRGGGARGKW